MATANPTGTRRAYPADARTAESTRIRTEKGISLARGPALILGTILTAVGLYLLYKARTFPPFSNFTNGTVTRDGDFLFGLFGANGWTGMLTAVGGGLLLFGAAQHLLAKTMSLIVGIALGAAAVIALISGNVLGMAAANGWTKLGWGVAAVILLFNTLIPRRRREVVVADGAVARDAPVAYERRPVATDDAGVVRGDEAAPTVLHRHDVAEPTAVRREGEPVVADTAGEPIVANRADDPTVMHDEPTAVNRDGVAEPTVVNRGDEPAEIRRD